MSCCSHCAATASKFDPKHAENDRARYQRRGPDPTTRLIVEQLRTVTRPGDTLLDVGGGIGVIGLELQPSGLRHIVLVDAAPGALSVAERLFANARSSAARPDGSGGRALCARCACAWSLIFGGGGFAACGR